MAQTPGPVGSPEGAWREQLHWIPTTEAAGNVRLLQTRICRPEGDAPAPVVVIAHGSPPVPDDRSTMTPTRCDSEAVRWFLDRHYLAAISLRRGYGAAGGDWAEGFGSCDNPDFVRAGIETARDIGATVEYAASLSYARPQGVVVAGQSAGGWGAIAYDTMPHSGVAAALINMAGGRGGHHGNQPNSNCRPDLLAEAAGRFGRDATTPMLWIYTENDSYFSPAIAAALYQAFARGGGKAQFEQLGPYGADGHRLFFGPGGSRIWGPVVDRYLAERPGA